MNMDYKKIFISTLGVVMTAAILLPGLILAQTGEATETLRGFCGRLSDISSKIAQRMDEKEVRLEEKRTEILNNLETRRGERDAKLTEKRVEWDTKRTEVFAKLEERAGTDEQKQAVAVFVAAVQAAVAVRRASVDAAVQGFRGGLAEAMAARQAAVDGIVSAFRASTEAALQKASSDCQAGVTPATVRENFRVELVAARNKFASDRQEIDKLRTSREALLTARREAIKEAVDAFQVVLEQARAALKASFSQESP